MEAAIANGCFLAVARHRAIERTHRPFPILESIMSRCLIVLLLGSFLVLTARLLHQRLQTGAGLPPCSVYSDRADGLGEAAYLVRELGYQATPLTRLPAASLQRGLLILAEPIADDLGEPDAGALLSWVESGNTLLLASSHSTPLHQLLRLTLHHPPDEITVAVAPEAVGPYTEGITEVAVVGATWVQGPGALPLWEVDDRPGAVLLRRGKGHVLVLADPALLTRHGLHQADNAAFLANTAAVAASAGVVYFDEYHHGLQSSGGFWGYLGHYRQQLTLVPIAAVLGAALWRALVRLGPAVTAPPETRADAVDYASALARLYEGTGAHRLLARMLVRDFLEALTRFLRLRRNALPAEILAALQQHDAGPALARLQGLLRGTTDLRGPTVTQRQLFHWAREFDRFQREVLHG
jgi:hypothetical protein